METTTTYRDYAFEDLAGGTFAIDTSGEHAIIRAATNHPELSFDIEIDRDTARTIGTFLIRCAGNPSLHAYDDFNPTTGALEIDVVDGEVDITVALDGEISGYAPTQEQAVDLGQRLITWAGVKVTVDA